MSWYRVVFVSLLIVLSTSCVSEPKKVSFKWDQKKDKEEVELLVRYMEAYPLVFKEKSKLELQQLFAKRTSLLEAFSESIYPSNDFQKYWELRKIFFTGLELNRIGEDRFEKQYLTLRNADPKSFLKLSEFVYLVFRSDKNEVKSIVANQIQAQNTVK